VGPCGCILEACSLSDRENAVERRTKIHVRCVSLAGSASNPSKSRRPDLGIVVGVRYIAGTQMKKSAHECKSRPQVNVQISKPEAEVYYKGVVEAFDQVTRVICANRGPSESDSLLVIRVSRIHRL
jgi:hypothetical protein